MKKKIIFSVVILTLNGMYVFSQSLSYTTWTVYDTASTFFSYMHFGADTLFHSTDNVSYTNISTYQTNSNNFTLLDLPNGPCPQDTGDYTFLIYNDTLKFTLVNDNCPTRSTIISSYYWVRLTTAIPVINLASSVNVYPNPTMGLLTIPIDGEKNIIISNLQGQIVKTIKTDTKSISLFDLATGSYFVRVFNGDNKLLTTRQIIYEN